MPAITSTRNINYNNQWLFLIYYDWILKYYL